MAVLKYLNGAHKEECVQHYTREKDKGQRTKLQKDKLQLYGTGTFLITGNTSNV